MGLFDKFKKSKVNKQMNKPSFDRMEYHFDEAHQRHITLKDKDVEALTEEEELEIIRCAGTHIGFFLTWVINELHDLPLEFVGSWEDYHQFEHILDEAYASYCKA